MKRYYYESDALNGEFSIRLSKRHNALGLAVCFYTMDAASYVAVFVECGVGERKFLPELSFGEVSKCEKLK